MQRGELETFIEGQIKSGYSQEQITSYLLKYGYDLNIINQCFESIHSEEETLVSFAKDHLKKGFTLQQISEHFRKYGVPETQIHNCLLITIREKENAGFSLNKFIKTDYFKYGVPTAFTLIFIILLVGLFANIGEQKLLDVNVNILSEYARAGEDLKININAQNFGKSGRYDINAKVELVGTNVEYSEEFAIETSVSKQIILPLPMNLEKGDYLLKTTISYEGKTEARSSINLYVNEARIVEKNDEIPATTPEDNTSDSQNNNNSEVIVPDSDANNNTNQTINSTNTNTSNSDNNNNNNNEGNQTDENPDETYYNSAIENLRPEDCYFIQDSDYKDECYFKVSEKTTSKETCDKIDDDQTKDQCYLRIASLGNTEGCEEIKEDSYRKICQDIELNKELE